MTAINNVDLNEVTEILQIITAPQNMVCVDDITKASWPVVCLALVEDTRTKVKYVLPMDMNPEGDVALLFPCPEQKIFINHKQEK